MGNTPLFQFLPHDPRQGAEGGLVDVRDLKSGGVQLVAGAHRADEGCTGGVGHLCQQELGGDGIDGIHHIVILGEVEFCCRIRQEEGREGTDLAVRVNGEDPLFGGIHLQLADSMMGGNDLPVDIRQADPVMVNQINGADAAAGQGLHHMAAYTANAENGHPGGM